jgi:SAM-dependent methyltransferase
MANTGRSPDEDNRRASPDADGTFPLTPPLPLPAGQTADTITKLFASMELEGARREEMRNYWRQDWPRFVYTLGLAHGQTGECLELGANPYYTTLLLKHFTSLDLSLANYFGEEFPGPMRQTVRYNNPVTGKPASERLKFFHFNVEQEEFPFSDHRFDLVVFGEIIEHLQNDPVRVLHQIKRVLKPSGQLILTTPNVSRLENVCRMIAGVNIYDPYSGYGAYGRHNREYNRHELTLLLDYCGFDIEIAFSADVHENVADQCVPVAKIAPLLKHREHDLGQYLFVRAINARPAKTRRPGWLYRSYPAGELEL